MSPLMRIFEGAPIWVWPLLIGLIIVGLISTRTRNAPVLPYLLMPLLGILGVRVVSTLSFPILGAAVFAAIYALCVYAGFRWQNRLILSRTGKKIQVKGEWITLLVILTIFVINFLNGALSGMGKPIVETPIYAAIIAGILGACSGMFLGRAIRVFTYKTPEVDQGK